jgi:anaerobic selenocysteine-containing dehydrogenase
MIAARPRWAPFAASIVYRTLGRALRTARADSARVPPAAAAPLLGLALELASREPAAVRRAGHRGNRLSLGVALFRAILDQPAGTLVTRHEMADTWKFIKHADRRAHLDVPEMLQALRSLHQEAEATNEADARRPLVLIAGDRRSYNANQIYRDPAWRRVDPDGAMRMHPDDARALGLEAGSRAVCASERGEVDVTIEIDDTLRPGVVVLPHGYGMRYRGGEPIGPQINRLTSSDHCDPLARTPYHKHVRVSVRAAARS